MQCAQGETQGWLQPFFFAPSWSELITGPLQRFSISKTVLKVQAVIFDPARTARAFSVPRAVGVLAGSAALHWCETVLEIKAVKEKHIDSSSVSVTNISYLQCFSTQEERNDLKRMLHRGSVSSKVSMGVIKWNKAELWRVVGEPGCHFSNDNFSASKKRSLVGNQCISEGKAPTQLKLHLVVAKLRDPEEPFWTNLVTKDHFLAMEWKDCCQTPAWPQDPRAAGSSYSLRSTSTEVMLMQSNVRDISLGCRNRSLPILLVAKLTPVSQERSLKEQRPGAVWLLPGWELLWAS